MSWNRAAMMTLILLGSACGGGDKAPTTATGAAGHGHEHGPNEAVGEGEAAEGDGGEGEGEGEGEGDATSDADADAGDEGEGEGDAGDEGEGDAAADAGDDPDARSSTDALTADAKATPPPANPPPDDQPTEPAPVVPDAPPEPEPTGGKKNVCPGIDGALSALIKAEDRAAEAKSRGLTMVEERVRVVAELTAADADLEGPVEEELRSGTNAQVLIQPDSICEFAASAGVRRVRKPAAPSAK